MNSGGARAAAQRRSLPGLHFAVVGAYVADCFVVTPRLPRWGQEQEARSVRTSPGGKALNQAVALARLGGQVAAVGVVGDDGVGHDIVSALNREGVDTAAVESRPGVSSAVCVCFVGDDGEKSIVWHVDDEVAVTPETIWAAVPAIRRADAVLITFEMSAQVVRTAIEATQDTRALVVVQPAPQLAEPVTVALPWSMVDLVIANETEARALLKGHHRTDVIPAHELASALTTELQVPEAVVTLGEFGCVLHSNGSAHRYPAEKVAAVDTIGAGDAFAASLVAGLAAGIPAPEAICPAQSAATWTVRHMGGSAAMPGPAEVFGPLGAAELADARQTDDV